MKKIYCALFIFCAGVLFTGCKSDSDVLATYKGGEITRGDFYKWLESKRFMKDSVIKSKAKQKDKLKKLVVERIIIAKAKDEGFDKSEEFKASEGLATEGHLMKKLYDKEIRDKAHFQEPAIKVSQILLRVKDYKIDTKKKNKKIKLGKEELDKKYEETIAKAKDIIEKLDKGESFEELAKKYSEDFSKKKGGDIGFIVYDMNPPDFSEAAFSLKEGEYTKEPVRTSKGIYIIKIEAKEELSEKNIEDVIENKGQAMRLKTGMFRKYAKEYIDKLMTATDVKLFDDKFTSKMKTDVIFKIGERAYTVANLEKRIELRQQGARKGKKAMPKITDDRKKNMAKNYYKYEILKRVAIEKGIDKDPDYLKEMQLRMDGILAREYTKKIFSDGISVSKDELREEYNKNKDKRYYKMIKKGKKRVKQVEPFNKVQDRIQRNLESRKKSEKKKNWKKQALEEYTFKIDDSNLEGE